MSKKIKDKVKTALINATLSSVGYLPTSKTACEVNENLICEIEADRDEKTTQNSLIYVEQDFANKLTKCKKFAFKADYELNMMEAKQKTTNQIIANVYCVGKVDKKYYPFILKITLQTDENNVNYSFAKSCFYTIFKENKIFILNRFDPSSRFHCNKYLDENGNIATNEESKRISGDCSHQHFYDEKVLLAMAKENYNKLQNVTEKTKNKLVKLDAKKIKQYRTIADLLKNNILLNNISCIIPLKKKQSISEFYEKSLKEEKKNIENLNKATNNQKFFNHLPINTVIKNIMKINAKEAQNEQSN